MTKEVKLIKRGELIEFVCNNEVIAEAKIPNEDGLRKIVEGKGTLIILPRDGHKNFKLDDEKIKEVAAFILMDKMSA